MNFWINGWIKGLVAIAVLLLIGAMSVWAESATDGELDEINRVLKEQEQIIRELKERIEELEGKAAPPASPPAEQPTPADTEPSGAPTPPEQAEVLGEELPITFRDAMRDRQRPAPRPEDYTFNPEYGGYTPIPQTPLMIKFNGIPRLDLDYTSAATGSDFRFVPAFFFVEGEPGYDSGWRVMANANASQLRLDVRAPSEPGDLRFYYQNDFFGSDTKHIQYRLQHLYGQFHGLIGGFTFGVFENPDAWPDTVDYEGPNSLIFARRALMHYKRVVSEERGLSLTVGLEAPDFSVDTTGDPNAGLRRRVPDGGFNLRWTPGELGHIQFSSIFRSIGIDGVTVPDDDVFGWGVNVSGNLNLSANDALQFMFVYGDGVGGLGNDTSFISSDAALNANGRLEALDYWSTFIALTHSWTPRWRSTFTHGYVNLENTAMQDANAYHASHYASANLIYEIFKGTKLGLETLYGHKEVRSGSSVDVFRVQLGLNFSFFDAFAID